MQKIVDLLEQHVQWLVLGLGVAWLLYVVWGYVITPPVTVDVAGQTVTPDRVDELVNSKAEQLSMAMKGSRARVDLTMVDPVEGFLSAVNTVPPKADLPAVAFLPPIGKLESVSSGQGGIAQQDPADPAAKKMETLPVAPALTDVRTRLGRSTVLMPDPAGQVDQANPNLGPVTATDLDWVTIRYTLPKDALTKSFTDAAVPQLFFKALILEVQLVREELLPDGTWGNQTVVPPLKISQLKPVPRGDDAGAQMSYLEWVRSNQLEVVQPVFYTTSKGDRWGVPGMEDKEQNTQGAFFDPNLFVDPKSDLSKLTPEQRNQVLELRRKLNAERRQQQGGQRQPRGQPSEGGEFAPAGGGRGGGRGPGGSGQPAVPFQVRGEGGFPGGGGYPGGFPGGGEFGPMEGFPGQQQPGQINIAGEFPIPAGEFDPRDASLKDITGWLHDGTVEPGRTYRYMVRYKMKNPIWRTLNVAINQEMANQFAIEFAGTEWTSPVSIPALTSFFLAAGFNAESARTVRFEVFKFQNGQLHKQSFTVAPGDSIGRTDKEVQFITGWSVVDVRKDMASNVDYVLITDKTGRQERRQFSSDQQSSEFKKLQQQLADQAASAAAGG